MTLFKTQLYFNTIVIWAFMNYQKSLMNIAYQNFICILPLYKNHLTKYTNTILLNKFYKINYSLMCLFFEIINVHYPLWPNCYRSLRLGQDDILLNYLRSCRGTQKISLCHKSRSSN